MGKIEDKIPQGDEDRLKDECRGKEDGGEMTGREVLQDNSGKVRKWRCGQAR